MSLTVVVAAHARPQRLRALLGAIGDAVPVVVVTDRASDGVRAVLAAAERASLTVLDNAGAPGPAGARNTGWRAAETDLVAFTDDDCLPAPGWTDALARAAIAAPGAIVQGRVEPHPEEHDRIGPFARTLWVRDAGPFFQTANILYPRALLERLGGFDESYSHPAGEDTDLGWRAREAGVGAVFAPDALVWHAVHQPGWRGLVRDAPRWGSAVGLVKRHPALRAQFPRRIFWKPAHERLALAVTGALLARRTRGASLAATIPYLLVHRGEHHSRESLVRALPAHLAVDAAELAAMAHGSARARTLLL